MPRFRSACLCFLMAVPVLGQPHTFQKVTIRPAPSADPRTRRLQILPDGDLIAHAAQVIDLISYAYDVPTNPSPRLNSSPNQIYGDRYDIEAKAPQDVIKANPSPDDIQLRVKQMVRQLLIERFGLMMRIDRQRMPVYELTISSGGLRLRHSAINPKECIFDTSPEGCHTFVIGFGHPLNANAVSMDDLARYIENWTDLPTVNRTSLSDIFTVHTEGWRPMRLPPPPPDGNGHVDFTSLPTIFTVLGRLGLELHRHEDIVPVYTVERLSRPTLDGR